MTPFRTTLQRIACATALLLPAMAGAEDIDIFEGGAEITGGMANVLIILDNSANWARASEWNATDTEPTQGAAQLQSIMDVLGNRTGIRVGLMMHVRSGSTTGGYVRFGLRDIGQYGGQLRSILAGIKANVNDSTEKVSQSSYSGVMREAYQYFSGLNIHSPNDPKRDYTGNGAHNISPFTAGQLPGNPLSNVSDTSYSGALSAGAPCGKNYIIFIGNEWQNISDTTSGLGASGIGTAADIQPIYTNLGGHNHFGDEWARFLYQTGAQAPCAGGVCADGKVITYTINVCHSSCDETKASQYSHEQEALLKSMAEVGGPFGFNRYFRARSKSEITTALDNIFNEIQAVNSVFTSASLPVSVNTQGTYLNQIYMGVFRPDSKGGPRWPGNLKQYKFGLATSGSGEESIFLADRNGASAVNMETGFISPNAQSYWTSAISPACSGDNTKGFWCFNPSGPGADRDLPDGDLVEKGGAAQKLRALGPTSRTVFTCTPNCTSGAAPGAWATSNSHLVSALSGASVNISGLSRNGPIVTVTTASDLGITGTETVTLSGTSVAAFNTTWPATRVNATTFTFPVSEMPLTPQTASGMTAAAGTATIQTITPSAMSMSSGQVTVNLAGHGFVAGQTVTIAGANVSGSMATATTKCSSWPATTQCEYNGTFTIGVPDANSFTYSPPSSNFGTTATVTYSPPETFVSPLGTATISCRKGSGNTNYNLNITHMTRVAGGGTRAVTVTANAATALSDCNNTLTIGTGNGNIRGFAISGSHASNDIGGTYTLTGVTGNNAAGSKTFTFNVNVSTSFSNAVTIIPASPATTSTSITVSGQPTRSITGLVRTAGNSATVTVTTALNHGFSNGSTVTIAGAPPNPDGSASQYNGSFSISNASGNTFQYTITTGPATSAAGGTASKGLSVPANTLIQWMRGVDNREDENRNNDLTDVRASIHGDVLHSRPLIINYGGTTGIYAFYGANDGMLRAVKVGQGETDGAEAWSFVAPEHYSKLGRLYLNSPQIKFPGTSDTTVPTPTRRDYFFDGNLGVYQSADLATTHIFVSMRRGGRGIYAFDVSNPTAPKFLWKRFNTDTGFGELGQTWSEPKVVPIRKNATGKCVASDPTTYTRALVFGAGYDAPQEDLPAGTVRTPTMGRGIVVLNAENGNLIRWLNLPNDVVTGIGNSTKRYSVPSDIAVLDLDGDGCFERLYVGDTGANLFRVDIGNTDPDQWRSYKLAALGDIGNDGGSDDRKILYPPDVVAGFYGGKQIAYVLFGTGDREKPRATNVQDMFFMVRDTLSGDTSLPVYSVGNPAPTVTPIKLGDTGLHEVTNFANPGFNALAVDFKGWYVKYTDDNSNLGEKTVNAPRTVGGVTFFGTNRPQTAAEILANRECRPNLGIARGYAVNFLYGTPAFDRDGDGDYTRDDLYANFVGGGLPPSPVSGVVDIDGKLVRFLIGGGGTGAESSPIQGAKMIAAPSSRRTRAFWYFNKDD